MFRKSSLLVTLVLTAAISAFGHEGHGVLHGHEPGHYLFSAEHAIPLMLAVALIAFLVGRKVWLTQKK